MGKGTERGSRGPGFTIEHRRPIGLSTSREGLVRAPPDCIRTVTRDLHAPALPGLINNAPPALPLPWRVDQVNASIDMNPINPPPTTTPKADAVIQTPPLPPGNALRQPTIPTATGTIAAVIP